MYAKLPEKIRQKYKERRSIFIENKFHPVLDNHSLTGKYEGCRSIDITGNYRAIFREDNDSIIFLAVGTHPQLYG